MDENTNGTIVDDTPEAKLERRKAESTRAKSPKKPQDHKPKTPKPDADGGVTVEYKGAEIRVDANIDPAHDFELLDALGQLQTEDAFTLGKVIRMVVLPGEFPKLLEACRGENGKIEPEDVAGFLPLALEAGGLGN